MPTQFFEAINKRGHTVDHYVVDVVQRIAVDRPSVFEAGRPYEVDRFCSHCGAPVITQCQYCGSGMPFSGVLVVGGSPDPFCRRCGSPFPWASRRDRVGQLITLLEHEDLDDPTRLAAEEAIAELAEIVSGDDAEDAALADQQVEATQRLRRLVPHGWDVLKPVLQTLLTSAAKQQLGLP